ncbi:hypothetical protein B0T14DRAFT_324472 [Immersiella caudata]|uniref:Uncharacterized protein n=1 Tax=Immersiella caudata TaxID=314043 RepID=A0AA39T1L8_9PEZI|nr:hypothetical protein B0T14DRAFT_324472 [Immersiella caudata]
MSDFNLKRPPPSTAYLLNTPFDMPTGDQRLIRAIAFSDSTGQYVNAGLSVVFTLIFAWLWGLVAAAIIYYAPHRFSRRRLVALVALRNCTDPWSAFIAFSTFTMDSMGCCAQRRRPRRYYAATWQDSLFGFLLVLLSLAVVAGSITMGIRGPPLIQIGRFAPIRADILFFPPVEKLEPAIYRAFRGDPAVRALSSIDLLGAGLRNGKVAIKGSTIADPNGPGYRVTYDYNITGYEFGLKHSGDLKLSVRGACRTEYGWLDEDAPEDVDRYRAFGSSIPKAVFDANLTGPALKFPPRLAFIGWPEAKEEWSQKQAGNVSFAILTTLAHRGSDKERKDDPWYLTENIPAYNDSRGDSITHRVKSGRPALSCWENNTWSCCGGKSVNGNVEFSKEATDYFGVPYVLRDVLARALLTPSIMRIGRNAGMSALSSVVSSPNSIIGTIDAGSSSLLKDMERLILAGYVSALNILSDTTMFEASKEDMKENNLFWDGENSRQKDGADDFVVASPDVQTFNLTGLIIVGVIVVFLLITKLILTLKLTFHTNNTHAYPTDRDIDAIDPHQEVSYSPFNKDRWARFKAFSAVHLLRNTYEAGTGVPEDDWMCSADLPEPSEEKPLRLVHCGKGEYSCAGHIATDPELLGVTTSSAESGKRSRSHSNSITTLSGFQTGYPPPESNFRFPPVTPLTTPPVATSSTWPVQRYRDDVGQNSVPLLPVHRHSSSSGYDGTWRDGPWRDGT